LGLGAVVQASSELASSLELVPAEAVPLELAVSMGQLESLELAAAVTITAVVREVQRVPVEANHSERKVLTAANHSVQKALTGAMRSERKVLAAANHSVRKALTAANHSVWKAQAEAMH
jgi:hypothetical protein